MKAEHGRGCLPVLLSRCNRDLQAAATTTAMMFLLDSTAFSDLMR
jgi:hypothetical protein